MSDPPDCPPWCRHDDTGTEDDGTRYTVHCFYPDESTVLDVIDCGDGVEGLWSWDRDGFTVEQVRAYAHALLALCDAAEGHTAAA